MSTSIRVLIVEDSSDDAELLVLELQRNGYAPTCQRVETVGEMRAALDAGPWDIILSDYSLPQFNALTALQLTKDADPDLPFIIVSGAIGDDVAVEAMRTGACDYFLKSSLTRLGPAVRRELGEAENRRARRRVEQTAYRLAAIVESSSDAIIATTQDGVITSWNPGAEHLYGYPEAEALGKDISVLIPARQRQSDVPEDHADMARRVCQGERIPAHETVRTRKDGRRVDVLVSISPIWDLEGNVLGASVIAKDVSQRKRAERFLAAEHATTRILAESGNLQEACPKLLQALAEALRWEVVVLWQVDHQGNVLRHIHTWRSPWAQRRPLEDHGQEASLKPGSGIAGRAWSTREAVWEPRTISGTGAGGPETPAPGTHAAFALPMQRQSEVVGVIEFYNPEIRQPDEALLAALDNIATQVSQVNERWQKEAALFESEQRFRQLAENVHEVFRLVDARTGRVLYVNPAYEAIWGRSRQSLTADSSSWLEAVHPEDRSSAAALERGLSNGQAEQEYRIVMPDGSVRWIWDRRYPVRGPGGEVERFVGMAENITRRKNAETASYHLASIVLNSEDAIIGEDLEGRISTWNPAAERLYGYAPGEVLGRHISLLAPVGLHEAMFAILERVKRGEGVAPVETLRRRKDGSLVDVAVSVSPIRNASGQIVGVAKIVRDMTERKRADAKLRASEDRYRTLLERIPDPLFVYDHEKLGYIAVNDAAIVFYGYTRDEFLGMTIKDIRPAEDVPKLLDMLARSPGGFEDRGQWRHRKKDGTVFDVEITAHDLSLDGRRACIVVARDVTARRLAAEALHLRDRAIQAVVGGIIITDATQPDHPIIYTNLGFERLTGYTGTESIGRNCRFLQGPETDPLSVAEVRTAVGAGLDCSVELLNYRKDGTSFWNLLLVSPVRDNAGHLTHFVGVQTDVTERRSLGEQFRQAQKMEAVGQLAGGVAHDFNNLLTVINGYGEIAAGSLPAGHPAKELIREITHAGQRAAALTRQLLAFSRKTVLEAKVLDLNELARGLVSLLRRLIGEDVQLATSLAPDLGRVNADPGQLEQAVINLCINARDAMPQGGRITLETRNVELDEAYAHDHVDVRPGNYVMLALTDTGHGMDAATQAHIFEPFFTTKEQGKGTGLGLAMVYGFVKQSMGHIAVYSEPGLGTTFKLYLPRVEAAVSSGKSHPVQVQMLGGNETLLLVEDEPGVRALARHILRSRGYTVLEAGDGREALSVAKQHTGPIPLLVTDVVMPYLGGRQLADAVLALHPEAKVLFLSGYTDDAVVRHGVLEATADFLQKPFTPASLALKVREILDQSQTAARAGGG